MKEETRTSYATKTTAVIDLTFQLFASIKVLHGLSVSLIKKKRLQTGVSFEVYTITKWSIV